MCVQQLKKAAETMREELRKLETNIAALEKNARRSRPFLVVLPPQLPDCSTCQARYCEDDRPCPDGYAGLVAKRAGGGGRIETP